MALLEVLAPVLAFAATPTPFDAGWKFHRGDSPSVPDANCKFGEDMGGMRCMGLKNIGSAGSTEACAAACCAQGAGCETWQFCPAGAKCAAATPGCWVGAKSGCSKANGEGWISKGRAAPAPAPNKPTPCATAFCKGSFDDSAWATTETPHDWAIEDLPGREADTVIPVLEVRNGTWLFSTSDAPGNANASFDDSGWAKVQVPHDWRQPPTSVSGSGAVGWYRRHLPGATAAQLAAALAGSLDMGLGTVAGSAEVFLNGISLGSAAGLEAELAVHGVAGVAGEAGERGGPSCRDYLTYRKFGVPDAALGNSSNVVAVRVTGGDASKPGGLYDSMAPDIRSGPFEPAASPGQRQTGYTLAGVGWYRKTFASHAPAGARSIVRFDGVCVPA